MLCYRISCPGFLSFEHNIQLCICTAETHMSNQTFETNKFREKNGCMNAVSQNVVRSVSFNHHCAIRGSYHSAFFVHIMKSSVSNQTLEANRFSKKNGLVHVVPQNVVRSVLRFPTIVSFNHHCAIQVSYHSALRSHHEVFSIQRNLWNQWIHERQPFTCMSYY